MPDVLPDPPDPGQEALFNIASAHAMRVYRVPGENLAVVFCPECGWGGDGMVVPGKYAREPYHCGGHARGCQRAWFPKKVAAKK